MLNSFVGVTEVGGPAGTSNGLLGRESSEVEISEPDSDEEFRVRKFSVLICAPHNPN